VRSQSAAGRVLVFAPDARLEQRIADVEHRTAVRAAVENAAAAIKPAHELPLTCCSHPKNRIAGDTIVDDAAAAAEGDVVTESAAGDFQRRAGRVNGVEGIRVVVDAAPKSAELPARVQFCTSIVAMPVG